MTEAKTQLRFRITGMDCAGCAAKVDTAVRRIDGVSDVAVSATTGTLRLTSAGDVGSLVEAAVKALGYGIVSVPDGNTEPRAAAAEAPMPPATATTMVTQRLSAGRGGNHRRPD